MWKFIEMYNLDSTESRNSSICGGNVCYTHDDDGGQYIYSKTYSVEAVECVSDVVLK